MSATNATTNYSLPLFIGTDKPAWLVDWNGAMTAIDGQMKTNATAIQANATSISGLSTTVSAHTTSISTITGEISTISSGLNSAQGAINTIQSLIGNGEPTTTDKTLIGAINEIYAMITGGGSVEIAAANVSYDGTTSGLVATSVQAAIDELAQGGSVTVEADDVTYDNTSSGLTATDVQAAIDELATSGLGNWTKLDYVDVASGTSGTQSKVITADLTQYQELLLRIRATNGSVFSTTLAFPTDPTIRTEYLMFGSNQTLTRYAEAVFEIGTKTLTATIHYAAGSSTAIGYTAEIYAR